MPELAEIIGKPEIRKDAKDKVIGSAQYVADKISDTTLYGALVRSPYHFARIKGIDSSAALKSKGVVRVITTQDIPGSKLHGPLVQDQPVLALDYVRHMGEPVALLIADTRSGASSAVELVEVMYEPLDPVFDPVEAINSGSTNLHSGGNLVTEYLFSEGDAAKGFSQADVILGEKFKLPRISPAYLEPETSLASWNEDGTLTVWVSSQHPFTDQMVVADVLNLPLEKVQVKCAVIGGAFGGKEDSSLAILTALGAWLTKGSVVLINSRQESFLAHPKRHPAQIVLEMGAKQDGTLTALRASVHMDTGAYASYGPAVGIILTETLTGAYRIPNVELKTSIAYTNSPPSGAMRGFGSPQSHFAVESMMDILAAELNISPLEIRRKNILQPGDHLFTQVVVNETALSLPVCLEKAEEEIARYKELRSKPGKKSGVGIALAAQSMGLGAKVADDSTHRLRWLPDGQVILYLGSPDMGQGLAMAAEMIIAETMEIPYPMVKSIPVDTLNSPNGNVSCASRMTYMVGNAIIDASKQLIELIKKEASHMLDVPEENIDYQEGTIITPTGERVSAREFISRAADDGRDFFSEATFSFPYPEETTPQHFPIGMPHTMFTFGAQIVRVEVDTELGNIEVTHLSAIHDVGKIISRSGVEGQIEGGISMGLGYSLSESMEIKNNNQWVDGFNEYLLPTTLDMPEKCEIIILEIPETSGPYGAKGIGEIPLVPTAPAVANAVFDAIGVRVKDLPITPQKLVKL
jgi:CO/xanthine dehydrogenase Mo-binding subunit